MGRPVVPCNIRLTVMCRGLRTVGPDGADAQTGIDGLQIDLPPSRQRRHGKRSPTPSSAEASAHHGGMTLVSARRSRRGGHVVPERRRSRPSAKTGAYHCQHSGSLYAPSVSGVVGQPNAPARAKTPAKEGLHDASSNTGSERPEMNERDGGAFTTRLASASRRAQEK